MSRTKSHDSETGVKNSQNGLVSEFSTRKDSPKAGKQIQQGEGDDRVPCGSGQGSVHRQAFEEQAGNPVRRRQKQGLLDRQRSATLGNQMLEKIAGTLETWK